MSKCLQCEKEYKAKRPTRKFCSANCRIKYYRAHKKDTPIEKEKTIVGKVELEVLYNKILELVSKAETPSEKNIEFDISTPIGEVHSLFHNLNEPDKQKQKIRRSFGNFFSMKRDCESEDAWNELRIEIEEADYLTEKERNSLLSKN